MTEQRVTVEITDGVADVRLNRPEKRNALDGAMFAGLVTAGERLKFEPALPGFAAEQEEIGALIGRPNQAEAVAAEFGQRPPRFTDPG
jgi:hypothetical protein